MPPSRADIALIFVVLPLLGCSQGQSTFADDAASELRDLRNIVVELQAKGVDTSTITTVEQLTDEYRAFRGGRAEDALLDELELDPWGHPYEINHSVAGGVKKISISSTHAAQSPDNDNEKLELVITVE